MAINAYSSYAAYLANVGGIQNIQSQLTTLQQQLNTSKKSNDLTTYGSDATRLTDLRGQITGRQGYMSTIDTAQTDVKAYDTVFNSLEDIASQMQDAFTAPDSLPPTAQQDQVTLGGDIGDVGDTYKVTVDGVVFSYVTNGNEGSLNEIASNLTTQINNYTPPLKAAATVSGSVITITGKTPGPNFEVRSQVTNGTGGSTNTISQTETQQGNISPIVTQVSNALTSIQALLNEQVGDHYLFGGIGGNNILPVVDLNHLPDPTGSKDSVADATTQQIAPGSIVQTSRVTADFLGNNQTESISVNGNTFTFNGPLTQQQLAAQMAAAVTGQPGVSVQDVDATGFTIKSTTPGVPVTISITGNDPTPSTVATVQPNVPTGANQVDNLTLSGPVGVIGETYSVTITDPPNNTLPVTISYRTDGTEKDLGAIAGKLTDLINNHQPPFTVTATANSNGSLKLSSTNAFTSTAAVGDGASVATTQRTIVPVAQEDQVSFPGPYGDIGDVYTINLTAPAAAGPFTVTTTATDTEVSVAQQMADKINAANAGVTAVVKDGHLSVTSNTPGTPFAMTSALTTDAPPQVTAAPIQTTPVANIPAGPVPQSDTISLSGVPGRKGDVYEIVVNGRSVSYTTDGTERDMDAIAINLTALINAANPPFPASAVAGTTGSGQLVLTGATPGVPLDTTITATKPTTVTNPTPTDYSSHQQSTDSALAWQRANVTIADQTTLKYTFSANDPSIQKLIMSLRIAQSAVSDPDNYQSKMATAQQMARDALVGIRSIHTDNTINDTVMTAATSAHQTSINLLTNSTDKIEAVDPNEIAAKIQQAEVQLQSAFGAFATVSKLSLINFLA